MRMEVFFHVFSSFDHPGRDVSADFFNKSQMFIVVMGRKEQRACKDLKNNASYTPNITFMVPMAALKNDFRTSVLASINNAAMRVRVIQSTSQVNDFDAVTRRVVKGNFFFFIISSLFIILIVFKKDVFGLEVCVCELDFVKKINGF